MNRQDRRRTGKRRAAGLAGISLVASTGLFASYLGNPRMPRAYASVCPSGATQSFDISDVTTFKAAAACINDPNNTPDNANITLNVTSDFTVAENLIQSSPIGVPALAGRVGLTFTVNGNNHTVSGDSSVQKATFLFFDFAYPGGVGVDRPSVTVSDLTIRGMRNMDATGFGADGTTPAMRVEGQRNLDEGSVTLNRVTVRDTVVSAPSGYWTPAVYVRSKTTTVNDSTFTGNTVTRSTPGGKFGGVALVSYVGRDAGYTNTITNSTFSNNTVTASGNVWGGAVSFYTFGAGGTPSHIENSTFTGNTTTSTTNGVAYAGALQAYNTDVVVNESVFSNNLASAPSKAQGGAVWTGAPGWAGEGSLRVTSSEFTNNEARVTGGSAGSAAAGGAVYSKNKRTGAIIDASTFTGNSATADAGDSTGGAVQLSAFGTNPQELSVTNSTFTANTVTGTGGTHAGGAIAANTLPLSIDFTTITGNQAPTAGGVHSALDLTVRNSIVNRNTATTGAADAVSGAALTATNSLFTAANAISDTGTPTTTSVLYSGDAQVDALANNGGTSISTSGAAQVIRTMMPKAGALVLDAGSTAVGTQPATDQRGTGYPRAVNGLTTMGAVQGVTSPPAPPAPAPAPNTSTGDAAITMALNGNGGTSTVPSITGAAGSSATLPTAAQAARPGYILSGWGTTPTGGAIYSPGASFPLTASGTLYAQWAPVTSNLDPVVTPATTGVPAGGSVALLNGAPTASSVAPNASSTGLDVTGPGWSVAVSGASSTGAAQPLTKGRITLPISGTVRASGSGYAPGSQVMVYLLRPAITLGTVTVGPDGTFTATFPVPLTVGAGDYVVQANGLTPGQQVRSVSVPMTIVGAANSAVQRLKATVYFASGSPELGSSAKRTLARLAKRVPVGAKDVTVQCIGFVQPTKSTGNDQQLSTQRAVNSCDELKANGVNGSQVVSGKGRARETTAVARRVEVTIAFRR